MDSKIQELAEKVYNEGVLKGQGEAEKIIAEAEARAQAREAEGRQRAEELLRNAERQAEELKRHTEKELQLYAKQVVEATRASVQQELTGRIASDSVQALSSNLEFMQKVVLQLVQGFDLNRGVEITGANAEALESYFASQARNLLEQGVHIKSVAGKATDFTISPSDGGFKIHVGEAEFLELFKSFLRPQLAQQLF